MFLNFVPLSFSRAGAGSGTGIVEWNNSVIEKIDEVSAIGAVDEKTTRSFERAMGEANSECISLSIEYRADCLAQSFREAGSKATKKVYDPVKNEFNTAAGNIENIVAANLDNEAPVFNEGGKTYRPIKSKNIAGVNRKVSKIVAETATRLIRSAGNSAARKVHFQRIAKAVDSTKVLLRS
ncbi:MAG: hypothetical protein GY751_19490 [Bacteroidetes bacterium]|nr:hypothetical protein [Bacteroidota bacterium]